RKPLRELLGGFERDAPQAAAAELVQHDLGGLLPVDAATAQERAAPAADGVEQFVIVQAGGLDPEAGLEQVRIVLSQVVQQFQCHLFLVEGVAADGATCGQVVAAARDDDARPQHARRVPEVEVV